MIIQSRSWTDPTREYRFGFNGQEGDGEIDGKGDYLAFEYRIHDSRLGRFLSVDPLSAKFPYYTPYQFGANSPILAADLEGLESSNDKNPTTYTTPDGGCITLPGDAKDLVFCDASCPIEGTDNTMQSAPNALGAFSWGGHQYRAQWSPEGRFQGYTDESGSLMITHGISKVSYTYVTANAPDLNAVAATTMTCSRSMGLTPPQVRAVATSAAAASAIFLSMYTLHTVTTGIIMDYPTYIIGSWTIDAPFAIPIPYTSDDGIGSTASDGYITLFRGVNSAHPGYPAALVGSAYPIGGHQDPQAHCDGNTNSNFTSWTIYPWIAWGFATRNTNGNYPGQGVVLVKRFPVSQVIPSPCTYQGEMLIKGPVTEALPLPVNRDQLK